MFKMNLVKINRIKNNINKYNRNPNNKRRQMKIFKNKNKFKMIKILN